VKHKRTTLICVGGLITVVFVFFVLLSSPQGKPSRLRYLLVREGMTQAEVETQLGPGNPLSEYGMKEEGPGLIHHGMPTENVELVLRWGFQSNGPIISGPGLIRVAFSDGKVCWKSIQIYWLP